MKLQDYICLGLLIINFASLGSTIEPFFITIGSIVGVGSFIAVVIYEPVRCRFYPCCNNRWIIQNLTGLEIDLRTQLHGQHIARLMVGQYLESHLTATYPSKALVLSFHGPTGVGKTFVSSIIAKHMYDGGLHSTFVHRISAMRDFPHEQKHFHYRPLLRSWIEGNVSNCDRSMFIFEEVDKLPAGFLDIIVPYVDHHRNIKGVDYRKTFFILVSNTGSAGIEEATLNNWRSGKVREKLHHSELKKVILTAIEEDKDYGLYQSELLTKNLINAFIPFLPLEKGHIEKCIKDALLINHIQHYPPHIVDLVLEQLNFFPQEEQIFSDTGCKRVTEKLFQVMG